MIGSSVKAALDELKGSVQLHHDFAKFLLEVNHYFLDYLAASSLDEVKRNRGFLAMISSIPLRYIAATCF
jgi:hypothetical protein